MYACIYIYVYCKDIVYTYIYTCTVYIHIYTCNISIHTYNIYICPNLG